MRGKSRNIVYQKENSSKEGNQKSFSSITATTAAAGATFCSNSNRSEFEVTPIGNIKVNDVNAVIAMKYGLPKPT